MPHKYRFCKRMFTADNVSYLLNTNSLTNGHLPADEHPVPADFFGICVATSADQACDDYIIDKLRKLNISHVRMDFSYSSEGSHAERFLKRLLTEKFHVCLHLVQPLSEARQMSEKHVQERWRDFAKKTLASCGPALAMVEIGSTCNRRKWCGYNMNSFFTAWQIAYEEASSAKLEIAGPNVTDFEPVYNIGLLGIMKDAGTLPSVHSNNLFVERTTEPESFDHKICGYLIAPFIKYNLVKKARTIQKISSYYGITKTICSHVAWSMRRINRILANIEDKQADYVSRYYCLAAASGALNRVYWGPMIGQREGLIDDGTSEYPEIPHVTFYGTANGNLANYRIRKGFHAYATAAKMLSNTRFMRTIKSANGLEIHEFTSDQTLIHAAWTTNGNCADITDCYNEPDLSTAEITTRDGTRLNSYPPFISESPVYISWPIVKHIQVKTSACITQGLRFFNGITNGAFFPVKNSQWNGICLSPSGNGKDTAALLPDQLLAASEKTMLRESRNRVWRIPHPHDHTRQIVVKQHHVKTFTKKLTERRRPTKSARSWNGANELLRRGISTPQPIAFFQTNINPSMSANYFICDYMDQAHSVRKVFYAFRDGQTSYEKIPAGNFYNQLALFLCNMHNRGVFFRDLSAGNVLFHINKENNPEFSLIDTARAHFYNHGINILQRIADLKRICHPLNWKERVTFVSIYMILINRSFSGWMKLPFFIYDLKHWIKQRLKFIRPGKKRH